MGHEVEAVYAQIGYLIRKQRRLRRMNQHDLASLSGVVRGTIANIETGRQRVMVHTLYSIARALDCSPASLAPSPKGISRDWLRIPQKPGHQKVIDGDCEAA